MSNEIKKAFETMKREIKKELGISGGFTMSARQIALGTATYCVCTLIPYEKEIEYHKAVIERVNAYTSWTDEEKARSAARNKEFISYYEALQKKYGTKEEYARQEIDRIANSAAFKKFSAAVGGCKYRKEIKKDGNMEIVYIRFNY